MNNSYFFKLCISTLFNWKLMLAEKLKKIIKLICHGSFFFLPPPTSLCKHYPEQTKKIYKALYIFQWFPMYNSNLLIILTQTYQYDIQSLIDFYESPYSCFRCISFSWAFEQWLIGILILHLFYFVIASQLVLFWSVIVLFSNKN